MPNIEIILIKSDFKFQRSQRILRQSMGLVARSKLAGQELMGSEPHCWTWDLQSYGDKMQTKALEVGGWGGGIGQEVI